MGLGYRAHSSGELIAELHTHSGRTAHFLEPLLLYDDPIPTERHSDEPARRT
jgi:hypothetical protein